MRLSLNFVTAERPHRPIAIGRCACTCRSYMCAWFVRKRERTVRGSGIATARVRSRRTSKYHHGRCGMRRLAARRRNILAAFSAIMGRLGRGSQSAARPIFRVHYRKLVDEYSQREQLRFMPALPDYMSYCCCRCGHTQRFKVSALIGHADPRESPPRLFPLVPKFSRHSRDLSVVRRESQQRDAVEISQLV